MTKETIVTQRLVHQIPPLATALLLGACAASDPQSGTAIAHLTVDEVSSQVNRIVDAAQIQAGDNLLLAAGDIGARNAAVGCDGGDARDTAAVISALNERLQADGMATPLIAGLGDQAQNTGGKVDYGCFDLAWGDIKTHVRPVPGNHEYEFPLNPKGGEDEHYYFDYWSSPPTGAPETSANEWWKDAGVAGFPLEDGKGYYSYDIGRWHIVALNSSLEVQGSEYHTTDQRTWLADNLEAYKRVNPDNKCTLVYLHRPRYSAGMHAKDDATHDMQGIWDILLANGVDVVLSGHDHNYQRWYPVNADGVFDKTDKTNPGPVQFVVGTGGSSLATLSTDEVTVDMAVQGLAASHELTRGVLMLQLRDKSYGWSFLPAVATGEKDAAGEAWDQSTTFSDCSP